MHILYLHQYFALPSGSTGTRSYEMARRWVAAGHRVTLICGRGDICGLPNQRAFETEGIQVRVVNVAYSKSQGFLQRLWAFVYFMLACTFKGLYVRDVDVIYATSTPLTIGIPAMLLKWFKNIPFIFEVRDQWPQIPIEMGIIKKPLLKRFLYWLEKRIYKSAAAIVALSPGMADGIKDVLKGASKEVLVASNSSDIQLFHPEVEDSSIRTQLGWQDKFVVLHFGAMGRANGLIFLIKAAKRLKNQEKIRFVLVGEGGEKCRLQDEINRYQLKNIEVLDPFSKKQMPHLIAACDVSTVIFADYPILEHNSANKFFDSLSAGKPILLNYSGWQRNIIEENECGHGCKLFDIDEYIEKLLWLYNNQNQLSAMGQNARKLAEKEFDRDLISGKILMLIEKVYKNKKRGKNEPKENK